MLIVGAGGLASQIIDELVIQFKEDLIFWSESETKYSFFRAFPILNNDADVIKHFEKDRNLVICVSNPSNRAFLTKKFEQLGGVVNGFISSDASVSTFADVKVGAVILGGTVVEAGVKISAGALVNRNVLVSHGSEIGEFVEIGPGAVVCGDVTIGANTFIGAGSVIIPKIEIGNDSIIAAGTTITKNVDQGVLVAGTPGIVKRKF